MPFKRSGSNQSYIRVGGIRLSSGTEDYEEAKRIERERNSAERLKRNAEDIEVIRRKALGLKRPRSWKEAVVRWMKETAAKRSLQDDIVRLTWLDQHLGHVADLNQIDREMVDGFLSKREGVHLAKPASANATGNRYAGLVAAILNAASRDWAWGNISPRLRRYPEFRGQEKWLTPEQWSRLASELPSHLLAPAVFSLATGLRRGNVMGLRWEQLDLKARTVRVHATEFKTGIDITVPLNDTAIAALDVAGRTQVRSLTHVFTYNGNPLGSYGAAWYRAVRRAGLEGEFTWHGFRHTFNTWLAQRGAPEEIRRRLCGWSSREISDRYTHFGVDHLRPFSAIIDQVLSTATQFATQTYGQKLTQVEQAAV